VKFSGGKRKQTRENLHSGHKKKRTGRRGSRKGYVRKKQKRNGTQRNIWRDNTRGCLVAKTGGEKCSRMTRKCRKKNPGIEKLGESDRREGGGDSSSFVGGGEGHLQATT